MTLFNIIINPWAMQILGNVYFTDGGPIFERQAKLKVKTLANRKAKNMKTIEKPRAKGSLKDWAKNANPAYTCCL